MTRITAAATATLRIVTGGARRLPAARRRTSWAQRRSSVGDEAHAPERHTRVGAIAIELPFSPAVIHEARARERHHEAESPRAVPALLSTDLQAFQLHAVARGLTFVQVPQPGIVPICHVVRVRCVERDPDEGGAHEVVDLAAG